MFSLFLICAQIDSECVFTVSYNVLLVIFRAAYLMWWWFLVTYYLSFGGFEASWIISLLSMLHSDWLCSNAV